MRNKLNKTNKINKTGCVYVCSYDGTGNKKYATCETDATDETEYFDPFDSLNYFEEFDSKIEFYGKKANKTRAEYDAMSDEEKLEYILLQYKPICLKVAKKYNYEGAEFQDRYMQACVEILQVIDDYGLDDEDLSYHILSRVGIKVKRLSQKAMKENDKISFDDEKSAQDIELSLADFDIGLKETELFDELATYLSGRQLKIACQIAKYDEQTAVSLAKDFGVTRQTIAKDLAEIREKLEPLRKTLKSA